MEVRFSVIEFARNAERIQARREHTHVEAAGLVGGTPFETREPGWNRSRTREPDIRIKPCVYVLFMYGIVTEQRADVVDVAVEEAIAPTGQIGRADVSQAQVGIEQEELPGVVWRPMEDAHQGAHLL